ncbi:UNVERIFIED_CONTAM: hypothetical protein PO582_13210, partial [Atlantibacter hermannii]
MFVELFRSPDWRGFFVFVESFRSLWAAVRINSHRRTRPGWGRSPVTIDAHRCPKRTERFH